MNWSFQSLLPQRGVELRCRTFLTTYVDLPRRASGLTSWLTSLEGHHAIVDGLN